MTSVVNNICAMNAQRQYGTVSKSQKKSTEKLSSGYRINRAADDAAGLTISEKMRSQIRGLDKGTENIQDGISLMQIADGALSEVHSMLHRATELAIKSANGTNTDADRDAIQSEIDQILDEIDHIGATTEFNTMRIFDKTFYDKELGPIGRLVSSPSADSGYLTEAVQIGSTWHPAATMDFSAVNSSNLKDLNGAYFGFTCTQSCSEKFKITFKTDGDGTQHTIPSSSNLSQRTLHEYVVDISNCTSGTDITGKVLGVIGANPAHTAAGTPLMPGAVGVSHSNELYANGSQLIVYSNSKSSPTEAGAKKIFPNSAKGMGAVDTTSLTQLYTPEPILAFDIQCSNGEHDTEPVRLRMMNSSYIGIRPLDVTSQSSAQAAINKIQRASDRISSDRSEYGAYTNRLEHSYANNQNKAENSQAAESRIRDTDIAEEMVTYSHHNILSQVGTSMMAQANQSPQNIISLLQ